MVRLNHKSPYKRIFVAAAAALAAFLLVFGLISSVCKAPARMVYIHCYLFCSTHLIVQSAQLASIMHTLFTWKIRHQYFIMHPVNKSWIEFALLSHSLRDSFNAFAAFLFTFEAVSDLFAMKIVECVDVNKRRTNTRCIEDSRALVKKTTIVCTRVFLCFWLFIYCTEHFRFGQFYSERVCAWVHLWKYTVAQVPKEYTQQNQTSNDKKWTIRSCLIWLYSASFLLRLRTHTRSICMLTKKKT